MAKLCALSDPGCSASARGPLPRRTSDLFLVAVNRQGPVTATHSRKNKVSPVLQKLSFQLALTSWTLGTLVISRMMALASYVGLAWLPWTPAWSITTFPPPSQRLPPMAFLRLFKMVSSRTHLASLDTFVCFLRLLNIKTIQAVNCRKLQEF